MKAWIAQHRISLYVILLILGALWIWLSRPAPGETMAGGIPAPQKGFLAPDFSLETADGEMIRLSELRGRPVLVNVWASWCPPCRSEMPALQRVYQEYASQGFVVLAVNAANQDDRQAALDFAGSLGLTFPILFDETGEVSRKYQVRALPSSYFIDARGVIQEVIVGGPMSEALLRIRARNLVENAGEDLP
jgi:peroxiredoxin